MQWSELFFILRVEDITNPILTRVLNRLAITRTFPIEPNKMKNEIQIRYGMAISGFRSMKSYPEDLSERLKYFATYSNSIVP